MALVQYSMEDVGIFRKQLLVQGHQKLARHLEMVPKLWVKASVFSVQFIEVVAKVFRRPAMSGDGSFQKELNTLASYMKDDSARRVLR
ncbi:Uncharacterised protein [Achromobacter xylosoxidans]|nr:Uncharacterised protein [Achromobacter xylosoxidans]